MKPIKSFVSLSFLIMFAPLIIQAAETYVRDTSPPFVASDEAVYRTPTIVVSSKGTILAFAGKRDSHEDDSLIAVALRRSTDGGKTWEEEQIIASGKETTNSIACPVVIPASDAFDKERIFVLFLKNDLVDKRARNGGRALYRIVSKDDGNNWNKGKKISFENADSDINISSNKVAAIKNPHDWVWYGIGPGHGIYLTQQDSGINGRIVFAARFTWDPQGIQDTCSQRDFIDNKEGIGDCSDNDRLTRTHLIYSDPDQQGRYKQWYMGAVADEKSSEAALEEASNGDIIVTSRRTGNEPRLLFTSTDGGEKFSSKTTGPIDPGGCQASLISVGENKEHIFISNPNSGVLENQEDRINGSLQIKNGNEWIPKVRYSDKKHAFSGYSDLAVLSNIDNKGDIGVLFERGGYEIRECNDQKYSMIENRKLAIPYSSKNLGDKKIGRWHMIDFKVIPKELLLENPDDKLKKRFAKPLRKNISKKLREQFKVPKNCEKIWSAKPQSSSDLPASQVISNPSASQSFGREFRY